MSIETLLSTQPYYHLILWLVSFAGLFVAAGQWLRARGKVPALAQTARVQTLAMAGVVVSRVAQALVPVLLVRQATEMAAWALPAERVADMASLALLAWAFVPALQRRKWPGTVWLALSGVLSLAYLLLSGLGARQEFLPAVNYNLVLPARWWSFWQMAVSIAAVVGLAWPSSRRADDAPPPPGQMQTRSLALVAFAALFVGHLLHVLVLAGALPDYPAANNLAVWVRLGQVVAYPMFLIAIYSGVVGALSVPAGLSVPGGALPEMKPASPTRVVGLVKLLEVARRIGNLLDVQSVADQAASGIAQVMNADQVGIALLDEEQADQMRLVAVHPAAGHTGERGPATFAASDTFAHPECASDHVPGSTG